MQKVFSLGGVHIYLFGITIALGLLCGYLISNYEVKRRKLDEEIFSSLALIVILFSIVGARLYYVLAFNLEYYLANPLEVLMIRNGGMSIQGGLIGGFLSGAIYLRSKGAGILSFADAIVPGLAFGQFVGRIGCDVFGVPMKTPYPWGIFFNGSWVHPVQIYEALLNLALFTYLWRRKHTTQSHGILATEYIVGFGIIRGAIEFFRVNPIWIGTLTVAHLTSLIMIGIGIALNLFIRRAYPDSITATKKVPRKQKPQFYIAMVALGIGTTYLFYLIRA